MDWNAIIRDKTKREQVTYMLALIKSASFWTSKSVTFIKLVIAASRTLLKQKDVRALNQYFHKYSSS